jgi:hypothetical protein
MYGLGTSPYLIQMHVFVLVAFKVTWGPCPSGIREMSIYLKNPIWYKFLEELEEFLKQKCSHLSFFPHCHTSPWLTLFDIVIS